MPIGAYLIKAPMVIASLYDQDDELMLFSDSMAQVITDWSGKQKPKSTR